MNNERPQSKAAGGFGYLDGRLRRMKKYPKRISEEPQRGGSIVARVPDFVPPFPIDLACNLV